MGRGAGAGVGEGVGVGRCVGVVVGVDGGVGGGGGVHCLQSLHVKPQGKMIGGLPIQARPQK